MTEKELCMTMTSRVITALQERGYHCQEQQGVITVSINDPMLGMSFPEYRMEITEQQIKVCRVDQDSQPVGKELAFDSDSMFLYWLDI